MGTAQQYRKRPVVIDAMHYASPDDINPIIAWIKSGGGSAHRNIRISDQALVIVIETLEGDMAADLGDQIIRGVAGEHYPCKPDIFAATYEPVTA